MGWTWKADTSKRDEIDKAIKREHTLWATSARGKKSDDAQLVSNYRDDVRKLTEQREREAARIKAAEDDMNRKIAKLNREQDLQDENRRNR